MKLVNLTPHEINIVREDGSILTLPPSGQVARIATTTVLVSIVNGIALARTIAGAPVGLPEPADGTMYIVSAMVRQALPDRNDLASPGELIRNADGQPIGCRGLIVN